MTSGEPAADVFNATLLGCLGLASTLLLGVAQEQVAARMAFRIYTILALMGALSVSLVAEPRRAAQFALAVLGPFFINFVLSLAGAFGRTYIDKRTH